MDRRRRSFIHSFSILPYDKSKASSKASCPHSAIQSFLLQMRVSSPVLKVIQQLPTSSSSSSSHFYPNFYLSFNNPLQKAVSTQNVTNPVSLPFTYFMQDIPEGIQAGKWQKNLPFRKGVRRSFLYLVFYVCDELYRQDKQPAHDKAAPQHYKMNTLSVPSDSSGYKLHTRQSMYV